MIISASRRTDIPSFFSDWFYKRIEDKFVLVRNPMNSHQISRIELSSEAVDAIVFWTKNPEPMLERLSELDSYMYYFQYTLNAYGKNIEQSLPPLEERIGSFISLSKRLGRARVIWRYDPILLNTQYTPDWHKEKFKALAERLSGHTEKCIFSFIDIYTKNKKNMDARSAYVPETGRQIELAAYIAEICKENGIKAETCAENINLEKYGIEHGRCVDARLLERLLGCPLYADKDKNQRKACGCMSSIDIGAYHTCLNGCIYCYANYSMDAARKNYVNYNAKEPLLCSSLGIEDRIKPKEMRSLKNTQLKLKL